MLHILKKSWFRFILGILLLTAFVLVVTIAPVPAGFAGDVIRHNIEEGIDATPLFYSEFEEMSEWENDLRIMRKNLLDE